MHSQHFKFGLIGWLSSLVLPVAGEFTSLSLLTPAIAQSPPVSATAIVAQAPSLQTIEQLYQKGVEQYQQGDLETALTTLQTAFTQLTHQEQATGANAATAEKRGEILNHTGLVYEALGQYPKALEIYQQVLELQQKLGDRHAEGVVLSNLGTVYSRLSQYPKALELYEQGLIRLQAAGDREGEAATLSATGLVYRSLGQYPKALELYQQALTIQREIQDARGEATTLNNIGVIYAYLDQYDKALKTYQQALSIRRTIGDRRAEGLLLSNLGGVYDSLGQYAKALEHYQQSLGIRQQIGDRAGEGTTLNSLAVLHDNLGQYAQAQKFYEQALAVRREVGDRRGEGITLNNLGRLYSKQKQTAKALTYYQQALSVHQAVGNRSGQGGTLNNLGEIYRIRKQYEKALNFYQQALTIRREIGDRAGEAVTLNNLGATYNALGNTAKALGFYQQALAILKEVGDRPTASITLGNLGAIQDQQGQYAVATTTLLEAIDTLESIRPGLSDANKVSLFETQLGTYRLLEKVLIAQDRAAEALIVSERGRARAFVELLATRFSGSTAPTDPLTKAAPPTISQIQQIAQQQKATLVEYSVIWGEVTVEGQQQPQEVALFIWVVQPDGKIHFRQANLQGLWAELMADPRPISKLEDLVSVVRSSLVTGGRGLTFAENLELVSEAAESVEKPPVNSEQLQRLHEVLIDPIADLLPTNPSDRVIFIPQGSLFLVPFAALQDAKGQYLIEKHTILTAPAIQVLELTHQQRQRQKTDQATSSPTPKPLIVGNPTMPSLAPRPDLPPQPLPALPGAEEEAKAIAAFLQTQAILGKQATKANILQKLPTANIVHLATHGLLDDFEGMGIPGAIALAPTEQDNGFLTASEILQLQLKAELVVLSACSTGQGRITGDGVIGLSRSLISAGAPSVIVSLWQVPDAPTAALMTEFYKNLRTPALNNAAMHPAATNQPAPQPDKAQALRQAMLTTLQQYPDPRDWAAFLLIGEAN